MTPSQKNRGRSRAIRVPQGIPAGRWRATRKEILARLGEPTRLETELVDRLVLNLVEAETALKVAAKEPYISGSRDQVTEHPGFRIAARCESTALSIATKLGVLEVAKRTDENTEETGPVERVEDELAAIRKRKATG